MKGDVFDKAGLVALLKGHDAVVSSVHFTASDPKLLIEAVRESGVKRYFVVGGAGSLEVAPGVKLIDTPQFPRPTRPRRARAANSSNCCARRRTSNGRSCRRRRCSSRASARASSRLGKDQLLTNDKGSSISFEDYAIAAVDELEKPAHVRQRFTVGY